MKSRYCAKKNTLKVFMYSISQNSFFFLLLKYRHNHTCCGNDCMVLMPPLGPLPLLFPDLPFLSGSKSISRFSAIINSSCAIMDVSGSKGTLYDLAISIIYRSTRAFGGAWTDNLCITFSLTLLSEFERQAWANSLPYLLLNSSAMDLNSCTSAWSLGVAQIKLAMASSRPGSISLQKWMHLINCDVQ